MLDTGCVSVGDKDVWDFMNLKRINKELQISSIQYPASV